MSATIKPPMDPRAAMAARNNADWYAMMWEIRGLRYLRDASGFCAIDPPPPYHGWVTAAANAARLEELVAPLLNRSGFAVKDATGAHDLSRLGLEKMFDASWIWHAPGAPAEQPGWERIQTSDALLQWEDAWRDTSPTDQRQFPDPILERDDVAIWGRRRGDGYDAGAVVNVSDDCVGISNTFGAEVWPSLATLSQGKPLVGYERGDDLKDARVAGWQVTGPLTVWARPR